MFSSLRRVRILNARKLINKLRNVTGIKHKQLLSTPGIGKNLPRITTKQENRMNSILDLWDYELERNNAGAFGMQYIVSHPTTKIQSKHILKATSLFQQIMGYIAGADGLSKAEIDLLCQNQQLLCNYTFTSKVALKNLEIGANFTDNELDNVISKYLNECGLDENENDKHQHLVSGLYMCLCVSGSDGLQDEQISKYHIVAQKFGFDKVLSDKILNTYYLECDLIASFNDIYDNVQE